MERKKALITGASRGIGRATAVAFAEAGYDLYLTCRTHGDSLRALAQDLEAEFSVSCVPFVGDMGEYGTVRRLFSQINDLDVLVNNAGIACSMLLQDTTASQWRRLMAVNLDACFYTCKLTIPLMLRKKSGRILNVSSIWGVAGASMEAAYSASKGAVNSLTKALAKELAPSNIQVNAIACGVIDTDMNRSYSQAEMDSLKEAIPAGRLGTPQEVAAFILQIAHAPAYLTGQVLTFDGGFL